MVPRRRRRFQGLYYHSSPPRVLPMNGQTTNSDGRRRRETDDLSVKLSTIRIWMHEKDIGKLTRVLWLGQGNRLRQQASTNAKVKRFLAAVPYVMNSIKDIHQAVIDNSLETLQSNLEPPVPPALVTCRDANGLNLIHKAAGLGHATILEYLIATWPDGVHETDITGKTPLHWAASAKNNMRCYTLLTQAGCDEEAVDYKMKTPSFYRHKPNEIERAFLTYVPEAPRVSPDIATDWEALSDDMGGGKKLDIRIPEMNGFGRHSNAESNENASEAEMVESVNGHEDEDATLENQDDNDISNEGEETKEEGEDIQEPIVKAYEEPNEAKEEEEEKVATTSEPADISEDNKISEDEKEKEVDQEEKQDDEPQDEKQQTQSNTETTENLIKHLDDGGNTETTNSEKSEQKIDKTDERTALEEKVNENSQNVIENSEEKPSENVIEEKNMETEVEKTTEKDVDEIVKETLEENTNSEKSKETLDKAPSEIENSEKIELANQENENISDIELKPDEENNERNRENRSSETGPEENGIFETENESDIKTTEGTLDDTKNDLTNNVQNLANNITKDLSDNIENEEGGEQDEDNDNGLKDKDNDNVNNQQIENASETKANEEDTVKERVGKTATVSSEKEQEDEYKEENATEGIDSKENIVLNATNGNENENPEINLKENKEKEDMQTEEISANSKEQASEGIVSGNSNSIGSDVKEEKNVINENGNEPATDSSNTANPNQNIETQNEKAAENSTASSRNSNSSNENIPSNTQTPPTTAAKTESAEQENVKTEEDENNNTNKETKALETSTKTTNKDDTRNPNAITDQEFKELDKSLEEYKGSEENSLEKNGDDVGDKLVDNLKENAKETVNNVVSTTTTTKDDAEILDNETNNLATRSERPQTRTTSKKLVKHDESGDDTADEDEGNQAEAETADDSHNKTKETYKTEGKAEVEITNESNGEQPDSPGESAPNTNSDTTEAQESNETKLDEEERVAEGSITSSLAIEGFVHGDSEDNTVQSQTADYFHANKEARIENIIATGDMEQLAQIVLNGDGQKLLDVEATEPEIQAFLRNVPNYMGKIRRVHEAARSGSLLNLQQSLDRRKFAIAKDEISPEGATPLHVAVLFGNSDIVRYLAARFPETTTITDNDERTALHYAAVINDNGHFYNVLLQMGANPKVVDKMGYTAEDYLSKEELKSVLNYSQLLKRFGAEELERQLLSDQGRIENQGNQENNLFKTEQGKYLADNLADPLIKALTQVAQIRPTDPLQYLANYLQNYASTRNTNGRTATHVAIHSGKSQTNSKQSTPQLARVNGQIQQGNGDVIEEVSLQQREGFSDNNNDDDDDDDTDSDAALSRKLEERDEHGQSMLHFACARSHRKGGLIHLIEDSKADITYRDELYRTARDVSLQANQLANAQEIDRYVMSLAIVGDIKPFEYFAISGYDHIIDVLDDDETPIIEVVEARGLHELGTYLRSIRPLEELREELHQMIRDNNVARVKEIADAPNGKWLIRAKNYYGRTALHIAILKESVEIVEYFINVCPEALKIGDNLERTALHYAMGTNIIESISRILIQNGAKRTYKDLKGRQPSYYFMNKADILRLQEEEDESR